MHGHVQCDPTDIPTIGGEYRIFEDKVRTGLPYVQLRSTERFEYGAVLLDRNVVIGIKVISFLNHRENRFADQPDLAS